MKKMLSVLFVSLAFSTAACSQPYYDPTVYPAPSITTCHDINYTRYDAWGYPSVYTRTMCDNAYSYNNREDYTPYIVGGALGLGLGALLFNQRHDHHEQFGRGRGHYRH